MAEASPATAPIEGTGTSVREHLLAAGRRGDIALALGVITDWSGDPLTLGSGGRVLAAGDARIHGAALEVLAG